MKEIDARGLSCPQPVLLTKKALAVSPEGVIVAVDNSTAKTNVERFLKIAGYKVEVQDFSGDEYLLKATKE